jgi:hypothetical protein
LNVYENLTSRCDKLLVTARIERDAAGRGATDRAARLRRSAVVTFSGWQRPWVVFFLWLAACDPLVAETLKLSGDYGYDPYIVKALPPGTLIDARAARFRVANSKSAAPYSGEDCESGSLPINPYPLRIYDSPGVLLLGGRFDGEVPLESDWVFTYCNSVAVGIWDSPNVSVQDIRARQAWDAIRISRESQYFTVQDVWLSNIRDDCVEDDFLRSGLIIDVLFDGCFSGVSVRSTGDRADDGSKESLTLAGVLLRLESFLYKGEMKHGAPIKADTRSPRIEVHDSVFALNDGKVLSRGQLASAWDKIGDCRNNVVLWTSDKPWPDKLPKPPACFRVMQGGEARELWERARQNWIDCHPSVPHFDDDPAADPSQCDESFYGGEY